ncbi:MAG: LysM peptidoglycan-binding domain-containing protein [Deltaproteobacteria bacterium]|nr:LysM peptidoglycan-binding domain-containing protein [Deltaproteobacteria bacterium]
MSPDGYERYAMLARQHEQSGELKEARESWELAHTWRPDATEAQDSIRRLDTLIAQASEKAYSEGIEAWNKGLPRAAQRYFLIALRLDPNRKDALAKFFETPPEPTGIHVHKVGQGETLSTIAKLYFNDTSKFRALADYNKIDDPAKLVIGQKILIPGVEVRKAEKQESKPTEEVSKDETEDVAKSYLEHGMNLYREQDYESAAFEFHKVVSADPDNKEVVGYYKESLVLWGRRLFSQEDYSGAYVAFKKVAELDPNYDGLSEQLDETIARLKDLHYRRGIQLYKQEKLEEALQEWQIVYDFDPNYKKIDYYMQRCRYILKKIKELKSSGT